MQRIFYFDLLRCLAAVAVVAIHVIGPFRAEVGNISFDQWGIAVGLNGVSRWAVPVFLLISGALLVGDKKEFDLHYYIKRRLSKVLIPFLFWSIFYAFLSGASREGFDIETVKHQLLHFHAHETYYHLGFFYYFIPLYFLAPIFQWMAKKNEVMLVCYVGIWGFTTILYLFYIKGPWDNMLWLYSGYLPLGYQLSKTYRLGSLEIWLTCLAGLICAFITVVSVLSDSYASQQYDIGRWLSYKTINTVVLASAIFLLIKQYGHLLSPSKQDLVSIISRHSLGIYLLHPIFLWPMQKFEAYHAHPAWVIPLWIIISIYGAFGVSWALSRFRQTAWLVP